MITEEDLQKKYSKLSNNELMEIIDNKFSYTELALSVVFKEMSKRNISEGDVKIYKDKKIKEAENFIAKNIMDDLTFFQKNLFFYVWFPFLNFLFKRSFIDGEYILKLKQANYYSLFGFIFFVIAIIIQFKANFSTYTFWIIWILSFPIAYYFDEYFNKQNQIRKLSRMFNQKEEKEDD